jgi:hypothetical protein
LQADLPGLGFDLHPNPSPSPNKPIGAGTSPFCKPKSEVSEQRTIYMAFQSMNTTLISNPQWVPTVTAQNYYRRQNAMLLMKLGDYISKPSIVRIG